jgi:hypothetical protein
MFTVKVGGRHREHLEPNHSSILAEWTRSLRIIDSSLPENTAFSVNLFSHDQEKLEEFASAGQAVLIRGVSV